MRPVPALSEEAENTPHGHRRLAPRMPARVHHGVPWRVHEEVVQRPRRTGIARVDAIVDVAALGGQRLETLEVLQGGTCVARWESTMKVDENDMVARRTVHLYRLFLAKRISFVPRTRVALPSLFFFFSYALLPFPDGNSKLLLKRF